MGRSGTTQFTPNSRTLLKCAEKLTIDKHNQKEYYEGFRDSRNPFQLLKQTLEEVY